ncbi:MAG: 50S ribosomal protein L29 [candidate division Zixibacteria bacterium]|nr:50S ribosomal protein L29 [candidate division Zixibacteria bacterium]
MKARELRDLTYEEVLQKREEVRKEIFNLRLRQATRQTDNPLKVRELRKDLARTNTVINEHGKKINILADNPTEVKDRQGVDEK